MSYQFRDDVEFDSTYSRSFDDAGRSPNHSVSYDNYDREDSPSYVREDSPDSPSYVREDSPSYDREDSPSYFEETDSYAPVERFPSDDLSYLDDRGPSPPLETDADAEGENVVSASQSRLEEGASADKVPSEDSPPEEVDPTADIPVVIKDHIKYMSIAQIKAARYLQKKRIFEFFNFLLGHLLSATPSDPILFLDNLLDKCLAYRDGTEDGVEPPLVFTPQHIEILYKAFDPIGSGSLSMAQYKTAMMTMGISDYNQNPSGEEIDKVSQLTFCTEAERCLMIMLNEMLQVHRPCSMPTLPVVTLPSDTDTDAVGEQRDEFGNLIAPAGSEENYDGVALLSDAPDDVASPSTDDAYGGDYVGSPRGSFDVAAPHIDTYDGTVHPTYDPAAEHGYAYEEEEDPPLDQS